MKQVCATDPGSSSQSLIRRICYPELNKFFSKATKWGREHKDPAKYAYVDAMKDTHLNFTCQNSGLVSSTHSTVSLEQVQMVVLSVNSALGQEYWK